MTPNLLEHPPDFCPAIALLELLILNLAKPGKFLKLYEVTWPGFARANSNCEAYISCKNLLEFA